MKKILLFMTVFAGYFGYAQVRMPAPSPSQKITQQFGVGSIELTYSRPSIKARSFFKANSDLAPLNKIWRLGANAATKFSITEKVMMGGKLLDTGSYVLYAIPGKEFWEIIVNKGLSNWGTDGYKEAEDVNRFQVKAESNHFTETFTMQFANVQAESCQLNISWANTQVNIPLSVNVKDKIRTQIEAALSAEKVSPNTYASAANFYFEWDKDLPKALSAATKATDLNQKAFWLFLLKAKIEKAMGDLVGAKRSAEKCVSLATDAKNDDYIKQGNDLIKSL